MSQSKTIMVMGGGAAGIRAALDLAEKGFAVHVVESSPTLGERISHVNGVPSIDAQITPLYPLMVECARDPRIVLHTYCEVAELNGSRGDFDVKILEKPRYVREDKCIGCQACSDKCPSKATDELNARQGTRKAVYMSSPESIPRIMTIDTKNCLFFTKKICRVCEKFCTSKAIDFDQKPRQTELKVSAIIVAPKLDGGSSSIFPSARQAGIYHCQYPAARESGDLQRSLKMGSSVANKVSNDMVSAYGAAQPYKSPSVKPREDTAIVDPSKCDACGACESLCASGAAKVTSDSERKVCQINPLRCDGCGTCIAGCPRLAISLRYYSDDRILDQVKNALSEGKEKADEPQILMFACKYCGFPVSERSGAWKTDYPENIRIISLPCSGRLDLYIIASALKEGADGVIISGCRPGYCHSLTGNVIAEQRYRILGTTMDSLGLVSDRVRLQWISPSEPKPFTSFMKELSAQLRALGPNQSKVTAKESRNSQEYIQA